MNNYNKLPTDIKEKIDYFIRKNIKQYFKENLINDIKCHFVNKIKKKLIDIYITRESEIFNEQRAREEAFNWLENDFCRWLNNDIPSLHFLTDNYKNFFGKIFNINVETDNDLTFYFTTSNSEFLMHKYFDFLTIHEAEEFEKFVNDNIL